MREQSSLNLYREVEMKQLWRDVSRMTEGDKAALFVIGLLLLGGLTFC